METLSGLTTVKINHMYKSKTALPFFTAERFLQSSDIYIIL